MPSNTPTREDLNQQKIAPVAGLQPLLAHRWSPRAFKATEIPHADLKLLLEAARWTASSSNEQPWRFLVGAKGSETHQKIFSTLVGFNQMWAGNAGLLILGYTELKDSKGQPNQYAVYDLGAASVSLIIQAFALGLHSHSMGGFDHEAAKKAFLLTDDHHLGAVIAVGHQDDPSSITNEQMLQRELEPRTRKPLSEIALTNPGTPFNF